MERDDQNEASALAFAETTIWVAASLLGPVPWSLLATRELERFWGTTGYGIAFGAAPAIWTGLALAALLTNNHRRWAIGWAALGAALWWLTTA